MVLINKKGIAKIEYNKKWNEIKVGFPATKLTAHFNRFDGTEPEEINPVWLVECDNEEDYEIKTSNDDMCLEISTLNDHDGAIVKVTLTDDEQKYMSDSIELKVVTLG